MTKDGALAGPRVLEHMVDCVLQFEGERERIFRMLRAIKNRFGSTNEARRVRDARGRAGGGARRLRSLRRGGDARPGQRRAGRDGGQRPLLVEVQALVSPSDLVPPRRVVNGLDRNRLALVAVLARHGRLSSANADVFVNIVGGVRIEEPAADLAVALAVASAERGVALARNAAVFGEIGLTGELRSSGQPQRRVTEATKVGFETVFMPQTDARHLRSGAPVEGFLQSERRHHQGPAVARSTTGTPPRRRAAGRWLILYRVGDKVVYPHHGAGKIMKIEDMEVRGQQREYLTIQILHNDMTVMVPVDSADRAGLRKVVESDVVDDVLAVLHGDPTKMPKNWSRRYKHNRDKLKTGDIFEVAEVVRNLAIRHCDKGLSTGEKQMFSKAKKILASELMYARDMNEDEANAFLDTVLNEVGAAGVVTPIDTHDLAEVAPVA